MMNEHPYRFNKYNYKYTPWQIQIQIQKWKCVTTKSMQSVRNKRCPRQTAESAATKGAFVIQVGPREKKTKIQEESRRQKLAAFAVLLTRTETIKI